MTIKNTNSDLILRLSHIYEFAKRGDTFFPDEFCNFFCNEFGLTAVVLFSIEDTKLVVLGNSSNSINGIVRNSKHYCEVCKNITEMNETLLPTNVSCGIRISLENNYEYCAMISLSGVV